MSKRINFGARTKIGDIRMSQEPNWGSYKKDRRFMSKTIHKRYGKNLKGWKGFSFLGR